ncbi:hypothetical protein [Leuconostoc citreum]|uniref:hypothetical protein n=1 Tax=Leuconostoc citreum TaxID=33964 RepID=UPI0032DE38D9
MANEVTVVNEWGQGYTLDMLRDKKVIEKLDPEELHDLAYAVKSLKTPIKNVEEVVKAKLDEGVEIKGIAYTEYSKKSIVSDDEKYKKALVKKYGWGALDFKSLTQLKKLFGDEVENDLEQIIIHDTQHRVKYE